MSNEYEGAPKFVESAKLKDAKMLGGADYMTTPANRWLSSAPKRKGQCLG